jgi:hypothetical protein
MGDVVAELDTVDSNFSVVGNTYLYLQTTLPSFSVNDTIHFNELSNGIFLSFLNLYLIGI